MKLIQFEKVTRAEIEKEAFDIATNNGRALLLQDLLKGADSISKNLPPSEDLIFLKQIGGGVIKFEVVNQKAS